MPEDWRCEPGAKGKQGGPRTSEGSTDEQENLRGMVFYSSTEAFQEPGFQSLIPANWPHILMEFSEFPMYTTEGPGP
ncbi:MAG: hypothetical protein CMF59_10885 [Leptospiraceae bacterium]|nr:hypothetical protein [Leptospiraceae bacterium]